MNILISLFLIIASPICVYASACCGGGLSLPSLIAGDQKAQIALGYSQINPDTDVLASGVWQKHKGSEYTRQLKLEGAKILSDPWQMGLGLGLEQRNISGDAGGTSSGLGDSNISLAYENLPEWDYNPYKPKGQLFLNLVIPTGRSIYDDPSQNSLDSHGRGFWSISLGQYLSKIIFNWDTFALLEVHHSFERSFQSTLSNYDLKPGNGLSWGFGAGYNIQNWRIGSSFIWNYEDPIESSQNSSASLQRWASLQTSLAYLLENDQTLSLSYSNQLLFGSPLNTTLNQIVTFNYQKRWMR